MESQPQNPEFRIIPENFHPCCTGMRTVSHSQSRKYVGWLQNGVKQFLNHLLMV